MAPAFQVDELLDGQGLGRPLVIFLLVTTLALVSDGFDIGAIGFVAPELVKQWHVPPAGLAPVLAAGLWGLLVGGPLFGFVGDRWGRKRAVVAGLGWAGVLTLACAAATSLDGLAVLRFLAGIGLGGVVSNGIALAAETAPRRWRGRFVVVVGFGIPIGLALPGAVAAAVVPLFGWPVLFVAGGLFPLAMALAVVLLVPESLPFVVRLGGREAEARRIARALRPDLAVPDTATFAAAGPAPAAGTGSVRRLFAGRLRVVTPMLWVAIAANQMANFFVVSWLPTLLQSAGASTTRASLLASLFATGGLAGLALMTAIVDRFGAIPNVVLFAAGVPLVAAMGIPGLPILLYAAVVAAAGVCVTGNNGGANATLGAIYPTGIRAAGIGWAQGMGRLGSIAAPVAGGLLLRSGFAMREILFAPALTLALGALAWIVLAVTCVRHFGSTRLREFAAGDAPR